MKFQTDFPILVVAGIWNNAIFNQEWVARNLLPGEELTVEFPLFGSGSMRISSKELRVFIIDNKLIISILDTTDETIKKIGLLGKKIAEYLPHTPVSAFGYNFNTTYPTSEKLEKLFGCSCNQLNVGNYESINSLIKTSYKHDKYQVNIEVIKWPNKYDVNVNYHFDIKSLPEFIDLTSQFDIVDMKNRALQLVENLLIEENERVQ